MADNPSNNNNDNVRRRRIHIRRIGMNRNSMPGGTYSMSTSTISTLAIIMERRRTRTVQTAGSIRSFHDNTSRGYEWLLPGWLAEERLMPQGRVYRCYYDPSGNSYRSQEEVVMNWELSGLIVIHDD